MSLLSIRDVPGLRKGSQWRNSWTSGWSWSREFGLLEHGPDPPQNSRVLAGSRLYQPTSEKSMLQKASQGGQRAAQMATSERRTQKTPINPKNHDDRTWHTNTDKVLMSKRNNSEWVREAPRRNPWGQGDSGFLAREPRSAHERTLHHYQSLPSCSSAPDSWGRERTLWTHFHFHSGTKAPRSPLLDPMGETGLRKHVGLGEKRL